MLSVPEKLRTAAMELLARLRVGLDIPSRAEVLDLAARIEAISGQMSRLEAGRAADSKLVAELRENGQSHDRKPRAERKPRALRTNAGKAVPAKSGGSSKKDSAGGDASKRKPRPRNKAATQGDKKTPS